ncbi:ribosomal protein S18 acetylase RimI-like enzyme [Silvimonas terrae]|uniref:Ribosomal protein S18 acetylase RimI-like enzyme n=1 Tax=Silvimonas terrae TaxID=300266 RepID=A0A840RIH4_9NEIS|nr:GNAT family N-acetyltransferase [Silvimonas terrae]MBB5192116.1 ribosomal protein S18 acetylase RimI-like enzyme [Silvimonas terrae]
MPLLIRPAIATDLPAVCRLADEINREHHAGAPDVFVLTSPDDEATQNWWRSAIDAAEGTVLVAQRDEVVCGFITIKANEPPIPPFIRARREARIGTIVVAASHRRQGIGERLLSAARTWAQEQGAVTLYLQVFSFNQNAIHFYEKHGLTIQSVFMNTPL